MTELKEKDGKLDTKSMLEENFFAEFAKEGGKLPKATAPVRPNVSTVASPPLVGNTEELLINAYDTRDGLISSFGDIQIGTPLSENIKTAINRVGQIIRGLGGEAEDFDPLAHMSGLNTPNMNKYATRVIENTVDAYSLGKVEDAHLEDKSIIVTFAGSAANIKYTAIGTITPHNRWLGTEAIDYIYTPGSGKMSVKIANDDGIWEDYSDNYSISWELLEDNASVQPQKNIEKKAKTKEEEDISVQNNLDDDIDIDFPIEEK